MKRIVTSLLCLLLFTPLAAMPSVAADGNTATAVLIDFGNGQIAWADIDLTPGMTAFDATMQAADHLGLVVNATDSMFGWAINSINGIGDNGSIGGYNPVTGEFWAFLTWNSTSGAWESSMVGASSTPANSTSAVAWTYFATFNPPLATPDHRYPWASYRHDNLNIGAQPAYAPNNLTLSWEKDLGNGNIDAPVVAADGLEYAVTSGILNFTTFGYDTNSTVFCLNETGGIVWSQEIGKGYQVGSPLIYNNLLIVPSANGKIYAFNSKTGAPQWDFNTHSGAVYGDPSPIAYRGLIYVASGNGKLFALYDNGSEAWNSTVAPSIYPSWPGAWNGTIYIGGEDGRLHSFNAITGIEKWNASVGGKVRGFPLVTGSAIVVTYVNYTGATAVDGGVAWVSFTGEVLRYSETGISPASPALCNNGFASITPIGITMVGFDGAILWNVSLGTGFPGAAPTAVNGSIYMVTNEANSRLIALSNLGEIYWQQVLSPAQYALSAPTVSDGVLYVSSDNGKVYAFNLNNVAPPTAAFDNTTSGLSTTFEVNVPTVGSLFQFVWNFGDGSSSTGRSVNHTYAEAGNYSVTLTISSPSGDSSSTSRTIEVAETPSTPADYTVLIVVGIVLVALAIVAAIALMRRKK